MFGHKLAYPAIGLEESFKVKCFLEKYYKIQIIVQLKAAEDPKKI